MISKVEARGTNYTCPRCEQPQGEAYKSADEGTSQLRVLIRCAGCRHRWSAIVDKSATK